MPLERICGGYIEPTGRSRPAHMSYHSIIIKSKPSIVYHKDLKTFGIICDLNCKTMQVFNSMRIRTTVVLVLGIENNVILVFGIRAQATCPWEQGSWGSYGAYLGPTGPRWAPCWPREPCYFGLYGRFASCLRPPDDEAPLDGLLSRSHMLRLCSRRLKSWRHTYENTECVTAWIYW